MQNHITRNIHTGSQGGVARRGHEPLLDEDRIRGKADEIERRILRLADRAREIRSLQKVILEMDFKTLRTVLDRCEKHGADFFEVASVCYPANADRAYEHMAVDGKTMDMIKDAIRDGSAGNSGGPWLVCETPCGKLEFSIGFNEERMVAKGIFDDVIADARRQDSIAHAIWTRNEEFEMACAQAAADFRKDEGSLYFFMFCSAIASDRDVHPDFKYAAEAILRKWGEAELREDAISAFSNHVPLPLAGKDEWKANAEKALAHIYDSISADGKEYPALSRMRRFQLACEKYCEGAIRKILPHTAKDAARVVQEMLDEAGIGRSAIKEKRIKEIAMKTLDSMAGGMGKTIEIAGVKAVIVDDSDGSIRKEYVMAVYREVVKEISAEKERKEEAARAISARPAAPAPAPAPKMKTKECRVREKILGPSEYFKRMMDRDPDFKDAPKAKICERIAKSAYRSGIRDVDEANAAQVADKALKDCRKAEVRGWLEMLRAKSLSAMVKV